MSHVAISRNGVPIRLTDERWEHILEEHGELAGMRDGVMDTISNPDYVLDGTVGELLAVRLFDPGRAMIAVYREVSPTDGFIITAFITSRLARLTRRRRVWPS